MLCGLLAAHGVVKRNPPVELLTTPSEMVIFLYGTKFRIGKTCLGAFESIESSSSD